MTTGRSGTQYLAELLRSNLPDAVCYHEMLAWDRFGVDTPDLSHMTLFNSQGNIEKVQAFWQRKLLRIAKTQTRFYAETSHLLMKSGLIENMSPLTITDRVHFIALERDLLSTIKSFRRRFDFLNIGNMWLWYLDPQYPKNLVSSAELINAGGINGVCLWYVLEIRVRAAYYTKLLAGHPKVLVHRFTLDEIRVPDGASRLLDALGCPLSPAAIKLPPPHNTGSPSVNVDEAEEDRIRQLIATAQFDIEAMANEAIRRNVRF